jgi:hypothetical protein
VFPIIDIDDLTTGGIQATLEGKAVIGDEARRATLTLFEVPASLSGLPRSHDNGLALREAERAHRILVLAPMSTLLGTML